MDSVFQVLYWGDFDMAITVGIATDESNAKKILNKLFKVSDVGDGKFKIKGREGNGEPYDCWVKKVKLNTLL